MVAVDRVSKRFGSNQVLDEVTFSIPKGKITAVMGPSGTGKSVLLKIILGLIPPDSGQVFIEGYRVQARHDRKMTSLRRRTGVLFQDGALFGSLPIYDNIAFPLREHTRLSEASIGAKVMEVAEMVGLKDHLRKLPAEVSGGMRKRAGLARALVNRPDVLFIDEPDSGLDPVRIAYLDELIRQVQQETETTVLTITHNVDSVRRVADSIGLLYQGRLVAFGPAPTILASTDPLVAQFLAGSSSGPIGMDELADSSH